MQGYDLDGTLAGTGTFFFRRLDSFLFIAVVRTNVSVAVSAGFVWLFAALNGAGATAWVKWYVWKL